MFAVIYVIKSDSTDKIYIGSTCNCIVNRYRSHVRDYKRWVKDNTKKYVSSYEILKYQDNYIDVIEFVKNEDMKDLKIIEGDYIKQYKNICVNRNIAGRKKTEYTVDNQKKICDYQRSYQENYQPFYRKQKKIKKELNTFVYLILQMLKNKYHLKGL